MRKDLLDEGMPLYQAEEVDADEVYKSIGMTSDDVAKWRLANKFDSVKVAFLKYRKLPPL